MRTATLSALLVACPFWPASAAEPKSLAIPDADLARAKALVVKLDADDRDDRAAASAELAKLGRNALPILKAALAAKPSLEVRRRVAELLPAARLADYRAGVEVFSATEGDKPLPDFEGWSFLKEVAGDKPETRKLFRSILSDTANEPVLHAAFGLKDDAMLIFHNRWKTLDKVFSDSTFERPVPDPRMPLPPILGMMLAESLCPGEHEKHYAIRAFLIEQAFKHEKAKKEVTGEGEYGLAVRQLILRWVDTRDTPEALGEVRTLHRVFQLGAEYPEKVSVRILLLPDCPLVSVAGEMGQLTTRHADAKHLPLFAKFLDDKRVVRSAIRKEAADIEMRDVALFCSILLTKQSPADYGFTALQNSPLTAQLYYSFGFVEDQAGTPAQKRDAGLKKWGAWAAQNLKTEPKK